MSAPLPGGARPASAPGSRRSGRIQLRAASRDEPEINLIPFIDVLLVILIFLMLSTTYNRFTEMEVRLPTADAETATTRPREIVVAVAADGRYAVDRQALPDRSVEALASALAPLAKVDTGAPAPILIISADAAAAHQSVITVMEAARRAGLMQITFATQTSGKAAR
ncbi:biopolymer transport protein ExbD [Pseudacidovorax intermedius]|uniref:Biopolymer transport protein ExbD n=1 Tax=Pseudacidovorax intermedius TaxID=433924 RepID=A0A370FB27_9BURK|nr:biopolymer transporter ExbD [Pseudacidovorax intermedius]RDI21401.1 biopolymer transport protein ExbD [Pseudacidovorax intermedius]